MVFFRIEGNIASANQAELLATMNWFATNYGGKIEVANAFGIELRFEFGLKEDTYTEAVATLTALQAEYGSRIQDNWNMVLVQD